MQTIKVTLEVSVPEKEQLLLISGERNGAEWTTMVSFNLNDTDSDVGK